MRAALRALLRALDTERSQRQAAEESLRAAASDAAAAAAGALKAAAQERAARESAIATTDARARRLATEVDAALATLVDHAQSTAAAPAPLPPVASPPQLPQPQSQLPAVLEELAALRAEVASARAAAAVASADAASAREAAASAAAAAARSRAETASLAVALDSKASREAIAVALQQKLTARRLPELLAPLASRIGDIERGVSARLAAADTAADAERQAREAASAKAFESLRLLELDIAGIKAASLAAAAAASAPAQAIVPPEAWLRDAVRAQPPVESPQPLPVVAPTPSLRGTAIDFRLAAVESAAEAARSDAAAALGEGARLRDAVIRQSSVLREIEALVAASDFRLSELEAVIGMLAPATGGGSSGMGGDGGGRAGADSGERAARRQRRRQRREAGGSVATAAVPPPPAPDSLPQWPTVDMVALRAKIRAAVEALPRGSA